MVLFYHSHLISIKDVLVFKESSLKTLVFSGLGLDLWFGHSIWSVCSTVILHFLTYKMRTITHLPQELLWRFCKVMNEGSSKVQGKNECAEKKVNFKCLYQNKCISARFYTGFLQSWHTWVRYMGAITETAALSFIIYFYVSLLVLHYVFLTYMFQNYVLLIVSLVINIIFRVYWLYYTFYYGSLWFKGTTLLSFLSSKFFCFLILYA